jgi:hypothetical protein
MDTSCSKRATSHCAITDLCVSVVLNVVMHAALYCTITTQQLLVFAHHKNVLDALEKNCVKGTKIGYIRIDGRTRPKVHMYMYTTLTHTLRRSILQ